MKDVKYYVLDQSIVLKVGGKTYTISSSDYRYAAIKSKIVEGKLEDLASLIDPTSHLNNPDFEVRDGVVFYREEPIPTILGDQFLEYKINKKVFTSLTNFWFNIKRRLTFERSQEIIRELISCKAYPITEDGFYLAYQNAQRDQRNFSLNKNNIKEEDVIHFYNISSAPLKYIQMFEKRLMISEILKEVFGFEAKKLNKLAVDYMFETKHNFLKHNFFFYGEAFKDILMPDNLYKVMEEKLLPIEHTGDPESYESLREFFKDLAIEKDGKTINQKKVLNFLKSSKNPNHLMDVGRMYVMLKAKTNMDIQNVGLVNDVETIWAYMTKEYQKLKDPEYDLKVAENFPEFYKFHEQEIGGLKIIFPKTNYDLKAWTQVMQNCIHSYGESVLRKRCIVFAVVSTATNEMMYNVEISQGRVVQFKARGNGFADATHRKMILRELKKAELVFNTGRNDDF